MTFLEIISAASLSGKIIYVVGFSLTVYLNLKVYNLDKY